MFDIPLIGEGTGSVESLTSYLHRCAYHHAVSTSKFIEYLHREINKVSVRKAPSKASQSIDLNGLLIASKHTDRYVGIVYMLTGRDILNSTLNKLNQFITQPRREVQNKHRWCPECFCAFRELGQEPYLKLIWSFVEITHCPHHRTPLIDKCFSCGKSQHYIGRKAQLDVCHNKKCRANLGKRNDVLEKDLLPSWFHQGEDLLKLLECLVNGQSKAERYHWNAPFGKSSKGAIYQNESFQLGIKDSISEFSSRCTEPEFDKAYKFFWSNKERRNQIWGGDPLSLKTLRALAFYAGTGIYDVLKGDMMKGTKSLVITWNQAVPEPIAKIKHRKPHDHESNLKKLMHYLNLKDALPLKQVARRCELTVGYIKYRFPMIAEKIVSRYKEQVRRVSIEKHKLATSSALSYFNHEAYSDNPKSRKQALIVLSKETGLSKMYLKPAIQNAYNHYIQST